MKEYYSYKGKGHLQSEISLIASFFIDEKCRLSLSLSLSSLTPSLLPSLSLHICDWSSCLTITNAPVTHTAVVARLTLDLLWIIP